MLKLPHNLTFEQGEKETGLKSYVESPRSLPAGSERQATSRRTGFQPGTATILSVSGGGATVLSGAALGAELDERPSRRNQVLLEAAVKGRQFIEIGEGDDPLVALARFDVQRQVGEAPDPDRRGVAEKHPGGSPFVVVAAR